MKISPRNCGIQDTSKEEIIADLPRLVLQASRQPISASAAPLLV